MYKKTNMKTNVANIFGALGYLACATQWLWGVLLYSNGLQSYLTSITPKVEKPVVHYSASAVDVNTSLLFLVFGAIVTIIIIGLSIYFVVKTPSAIVKTATHVVHHTAETITPAILHMEHKKDTPTNHKKVAVIIKLILKAMLVVIPFVGSVLSSYTAMPLFSHSTVLYSSAGLLVITVVLFTVQYLVGIALKVNKKTLW
jgi:hypothetical protein